MTFDARQFYPDLLGLCEQCSNGNNHYQDYLINVSIVCVQSQLSQREVRKKKKKTPRVRSGGQVEGQGEEEEEEEEEGPDETSNLEQEKQGLEEERQRILNDQHMIEEVNYSC